MSNKLEEFGELLMKEVRDESIEKFEMIMDGKMFAAENLVITEWLKKFNREDVKFIRKIIIEAIDNTIFNLLVMIEEQKKSLDVIYDNDSIRDLSAEGLNFEIFSDDGWIYKFSKYKENYVNKRGRT